MRQSLGLEYLKTKGYSNFLTYKPQATTLSLSFVAWPVDWCGLTETCARTAYREMIDFLWSDDTLFQCEEEVLWDFVEMSQSVLKGMCTYIDKCDLEHFTDCKLKMFQRVMMYGMMWYGIHIFRQLWIQIVSHRMCMFTNSFYEWAKWSDHCKMKWFFYYWYYDFKS